jgi:hypothetical protein
MRYNFAIPIVLFSVLALGQSSGPQNKTKKNQDKGASLTNPHEPILLVRESPPTSTVQSKAEYEQRPPAQEPKPFLSHAEWIMAILTAIYVLITAFYALVSHKTLDAIERQAEDQAKTSAEQIKLAHEAAEAAQKSASAALLNAQAMISAERPWIVVVAHENGKGDFTFNARNYGRTPAEIVSFSSEITFVEDDVQNLPASPSYSFAYLADVTILVPMREGAADANEFGLLWYAADAYLDQMSKQKVEAIKQGKLRYAFYFKVVYRNTLNKAGVHIPNYETCKCFWYSPVVAHLRTDRVPHAYNKST